MVPRGPPLVPRAPSPAAVAAVGAAAAAFVHEPVAAVVDAGRTFDTAAAAAAADAAAVAEVGRLTAFVAVARQLVAT